MNLKELTEFACVVLPHDPIALARLAACYERRANDPDIVPIIERRVAKAKRTLTNVVDRKGRKTA